MHDRITIEILLGDTLGATARGKQPPPASPGSIPGHCGTSRVIFSRVFSPPNNISFLDSIKGNEINNSIERIFLILRL